MAAKKQTITKLTLACAVACLLTITPQPVLSQDIDQLYQQGNTAQSRGNFTEAESIFRQIINIDPNDAGAYNNLGNALYDQGKLEEAISSYAKAIELNPNFVNALVGLGNALDDQGNSEEAIANYQKAIELDPNYAVAYYNLGVALERQRKLEEAIANYQKAIELDPNYANAYYNLGNAKYNQRKLEEAIANYQQAIELDPNYAIAYYNLGNAKYDQGKLEEAIANYQQAIELDPNYANAYNNLGNAKYNQRKLEEAIANYQQAIELDPNDAFAYYNLGNAQYDQGKLEEAIANYQQAIELKPNYVNALVSLGNALDDQGNSEEAIALYEKAIELDPNDAFAYYNLGVTLRRQGKLEEAITTYQKALSLPNQKSSPSSIHALAYNNLGYVLQEQGELEEAIRQYKRSLEIDPEYLTAKNNLREAERLLAIQLNPPLPDIDDTQHLPSVEDEPLVTVLRSTARIVAQVSAEGTSIGAGWVIKKEANTVWIVTNRHVVSDNKTKIPSNKIEVEFFSELPDKERPRYPATIINSTERNDALDLAVLEVTGIPDDIQSLELSPGRIARNTNVVVIGHPYIDEIPWSTEVGLVKNYSPNNSKISMSGLFAQGSSGGPVLNSENQVIAMMVGIRTDSDIPVTVLDQANFNIDINQPATGGVGLAYRIDVVVEKLREWGIIN